MSDVVLAALFGSASTAVVAIVGALAGIFGPGWRSAREARERRSEDREDRRFTAAEEFLSSIGKSTKRDPSDMVAARQRFVATLREGEERIAKFTTWLIHAIENEQDPRVRMLYIDRAAELIFPALRGELPTLQPLPFTPDRSLLEPSTGPQSGDLF